MSASKRKGTSAESAVVKCLQEHGFPYAERRALAGVNDRGDVAGIPGVVVEVKSCARMELSAWLAEAKQEAANAGVGIYAVWAKKRGTTDPLEWYVTMPGSVFVKLLEEM